jgi:hypothetical protein
LTTYHEILGLDENNKKALIGISSISKIFHGFNVTTPQVIIDDETQNSKLNSDDDLQIVDKQ